MDVEIFTGPKCGYCDAAKALLMARGIKFVEHDMSDAAVREDFTQRLPRVRSIPQIFIDGEHIGGLDDLKLCIG